MLRVGRRGIREVVVVVVVWLVLGCGWFFWSLV